SAHGNVQQGLPDAALFSISRAPSAPRTRFWRHLVRRESRGVRALFWDADISPDANARRDTLDHRQRDWRNPFRCLPIHLAEPRVQLAGSLRRAPDSARSNATGGPG